MARSQDSRDAVRRGALSMSGDIEDESAHGEGGEERGAPVRDERQREPRQRDDAEHRPHIDEGLKDEHEREAKRDEAAEEIARLPRYRDAARRKPHKERKQK